MVQWQRHIFPFLRHIHKQVMDHHHANASAPSLLISRLASSLSQGQIGRRAWRITTPTLPCFSRPIFLGFQHQDDYINWEFNFCSENVILDPSMVTEVCNHIAAAIMDEVVIEGFGKNNVFEGISSTAPLLANSSEEAPVLSPLVPVSSLGGSKGEGQKQKTVTKPETVQAILKGIKQSPKKVNLVAALVRGMLVKDALIQLELTIKRAAKTVYQVIHSARANASHNHGLNPERLIVAEAFVGKGYFRKKITYHGKGRLGLIKIPECRLTVVVREITPKEEADIARLRVHNFKKLTKRERRLVPHQLIETTPVWGRKNKSSGQNLSAAAPA